MAEEATPRAASSPFLLLLLNDLIELRLVLDLTSRARLGINHLYRPRLAHAIASIGLDRFGGRKSSWLAFHHDKVEYGIDFEGKKEAEFCDRCKSLA